MRDKRPVDELSIEELERILVLKRREARKSQLHRMKQEGRIMTPNAPVSLPPDTNKSSVDLPPELAAAVEPAEKHLRRTTEIPQKVTPPAGKSSARAAYTPSFEEDVYDEDIPRPYDSQADRIWRRFVNWTLLLVEVSAVFALVFIGVNLIMARDELKDLTAEEQRNAESTRTASIPTLAPTPVLSVNIDDWVLPGGHIIDEATGQGVQNVYELQEAGIPEHLLPEVTTKLIAPVVSRPPKTNETALALTIPALDLEATIVQGTDWDALKLGVGQVLNGAMPGSETGNVVLAAHNDIYGQLFRHIDQLKAGDEFTIRTEGRVYTYRITGFEIVEPTEVEVMRNIGLPTATLISCYPYGRNDKRYIVYAERVD